MKKSVIIIASFLIALLLNACGNDKKENVSVSETTVVESPYEVTTKENEETVTEETAVTKETVTEETEVPQADEHESAQDAIENMVIGWNLGNSFDATGDWIVAYTDGTPADFETAWGNPVTPATLMPKIKEMGFQSVRIPITWRYHFDENGIIDAEWMARVKEVVDWAMESELHCIINVHHDTGADGWLRATNANYEENKELFSKLWNQIGEEFKDYPDLLIFEGFNEMLDAHNEWNNPSKESIDVINQYNQLFVDTVRKTGGNNQTRNLVCCTYAAAISDTALFGFVLPTDEAYNHLIAEVHFYTPYEFVTEEGVTWTTPISKYSDKVENTIDQSFENIRKRLTSKGIPLIIGEFSADDKGNTEDRIKWYTHIIQKAKEQSIACFIWDNGDKVTVGHIDRDGTDDPFPEIISACMDAAK